jgi:hypothetical protein
MLTFVLERNFPTGCPVHHMSVTLLTTFSGLESLKTCGNGSNVSAESLTGHLKTQNCHKAALLAASVSQGGAVETYFISTT